MNAGSMLLAALGAMLAAIFAGSFAPRVWLGATLAGLFATLAAAAGVLGGGEDWEWHSQFGIGGEALHLRLDGVSAFFLVLLCVAGGAASLYAGEYWTDARHPRSAPSGRVWWSAMLLSLGFVLLSSNGLHFLIGWELLPNRPHYWKTLG